MGTWEPRWNRLNITDQVILRRGSRDWEGFGTIEIKENWSVRLLGKAPSDLKGGPLDVTSIYYTEADLIDSNPELRAKTYSFQNALTSRDMGLQILLAANWRPDCVEVEDRCSGRLPPPETRKGARILFGPPEANA